MMYPSISRYRVFERLGSGGEGEVWKAEDLRLKRTVAIKFLPPSLASDREAHERMQVEAQMAASLSHPNIATVYELGEADDQLYIVMECVEGETLKSRIDRGPLDLEESLKIATDVCEALKAAHARQLLHCDIKSSNIMVTPQGLVKVLDFGLACVKSLSEVQVTQDAFSTQQASRVPQGSTESAGGSFGTVLSGTVPYMSPEQVRGEALDVPTDIFSLGVVLYELLTARQPFEGERRADVLRAILNEEPLPLSYFRSDVPLELESIVRRTLAKERTGRYAKVEELLSDLSALQGRLKDNRAIAGIFAGAERSDSARQALDSLSRARLTAPSLLELAWRYRRWVRVACVIAASLMVWEILQPRGAGWVKAVGLAATAFLGALYYAASRHRASRSLPAFPGGAAFRGLLPFQEADRGRFYGRESDTPALFEMIRQDDFRFGVLFGESGCGKTSLLRAGLVPRLWDEGYVPIYCRSYKDPLLAALEECRKRSHIPAVEGEPPVDYLRRVTTELGATVVIVCDQFEEFFVSHKSIEERESFISFMARCLDDDDLPVKFLVSMRSDFLYLISSELGGQVDEPLISSRLYHLRNFGEAQAFEIIERSAEQAGLPFEVGLSRQIARDLASGDVVSPSELQIVGERLQSKRIFTVSEYRRIGGKEPLVESFLDDVVQASGDRAGCGLVLRALISDENTRLTLSLPEIAHRTQRSHSAAEVILKLLVSARLVREIQDDDPWRYEVMHEYLIEKVNRITGRVLDATQRANRLLRQYLSSYSVDKRTRIPISKQWFIRRYSDIERGERERELLRKSLQIGLLKGGGLILLLAGGATMAAAALSVSEEWEGVRLRDGHTAAVRRAIFSPDGRLLASCGEDSRVIVWDFARRKRLITLTDHTDWVGAISFSPDGKWLATGGFDKRIVVRDAASFTKVAVLDDHRGHVVGLVFSRDGRMLASVSQDSRLILWSVGGWKKVREFPAGGSQHNALIFSPDGKYLIAPAPSLMLELSTGERVDTIDKNWGGVWGAISPDGREIVSTDGMGNVTFLDLTRGKIIARQRAHRDNGRAVAFSPDGRLIATGSEIVILWDAATKTKLVRLEHTAIVWSVEFSPDGRWLVSTHGDGSILIWDVAERERIANLNEHSGPVRTVAFSADGKLIASGGDDTSIIVWDVESGRKEDVLIGHRGRVTSTAFLPDSGLLAASDFDSAGRVWDIERGQPRWIAQNSTGFSGSYCLAVSPDGRFVAASQGVYETAGGRHVFEYLDGASSIYGISFSHDGRRLALASAHGFITILEVESWRTLDRVEVKDTQPIAINFSRDDKWLVTGEDEGSVRLWEANPLRQVAVIGRHSARIKSVSFSPDGREVASASDDQTIALWDVPRRRLITNIGTHTAPVLSITFSPDGKRLASGEHDKSVRIYTRHRTLWGYRFD